MMTQSAATLPEQLYSSARAAFEQAARSAEKKIACDYRIAGRLVRFLFASPALLEATRTPFAHLSVSHERGKPDLTVCLWDCASTGAEPLAADWLSWDEMVATETCVHRSPSLQMCVNGAQQWSLYNSREKLALCCVPDVTTLMWSKTGTPLMEILRWWTADVGLQFIHAAAVGTSAGGVLLAGRSGSGKSTTAFVCLQAGMAYASDDYCLLAVKPTPQAHSIYSTGRLTPDSLHILPRLAAALNDSKKDSCGKYLFALHEHLPDRIVEHLPIRAVLLPQVTPCVNTNLRRATPAEGYRALAPSTIFQCHPELAGCELMAALLRQVPCYHLSLGARPECVPAVIKRLIDDLASQPAGPVGK